MCRKAKYAKQRRMEFTEELLRVLGSAVVHPQALSVEMERIE